MWTLSTVAVNLNIIEGITGKIVFISTRQDNATIAHASAFLFRLFAAAEVLKPTEPSVPGIPPVIIPDVDPESIQSKYNFRRKTP